MAGKIKMNKYGKILAVFLVLMLAFTVISRAADSVTVAQVNTQVIKRGTLSHTTYVSGYVEASEAVYVQGEKDYRISKIHVRAGDRVEAGDSLFTLDGDEIREKIEDLDTQIKTTQLEIQKMHMDGQGSLTAQNTINAAEIELARAISDRDFNAELNGGQVFQADKRKVEDAEKSLEEARKLLQEEQKKGDIDIQLKQVELQSKEKERSKLQSLLKGEGIIRAEISGTIGEIFAQQGVVSTGEDVCTIIPVDSSYEFIGEIDVKDGEYLKAGETVSITLSGKQRPLTGDFTINSLKIEEDKMKVMVDLTGAEIDFAGAASMEHTLRSEEYRMLINLAALNGSENDAYILVVLEENTVLGTETTAMKVPVTVVDKDSTSAAIDGSSVGANDQIIYTSNKPIAEGDRVRVME